jgi:adenine-specific DNA-methyltransferase
MEPRSQVLRDRSRYLRHSQTEAELRLWTRLRNRQLYNVKFRRQHPMGPFITDFCCPEQGLVIELDGGQHTMRAEADRRRSMLLAREGYQVLRFWDHEVMQDIEAVLQQIAEALRYPHPNPLPSREREKRRSHSNLQSRFLFSIANAQGPSQEERGIWIFN